MLKSALGFPEYGKNWDAFWDCVTDPDLSSVPTKLTLRGSAHLADILPREYLFAAANARQAIDHRAVLASRYVAVN